MFNTLYEYLCDKVSAIMKADKRVMKADKTVSM